MISKASFLFVIALLSFVGTAAASDDLPLSNPDAERHSHVRHLHDKAEEAIILREFRQALALYQDAIFAHPDDAWAYLQTGRIHMILGEDRKAEVAFANALHIEPDNTTAIAALRRIKDPDGQGWGGETHRYGDDSPYPQKDPYPPSPPAPEDPSGASDPAWDQK